MVDSPDTFRQLYMYSNILSPNIHSGQPLRHFPLVRPLLPLPEIFPSYPMLHNKSWGQVGSGEDQLGSEFGLVWALENVHHFSPT